MHYLLWQLVDSGFPSGGFAHSNGLEAGVQHGQADGSAGVQAFARHALSQAGRSALPLVTSAHARPGALMELDALSDTFLSNPVANRASRAQGRALLSSTARSFPSAALAALEQRARAEQLHYHYAPVFGATLAALDVDLAEAQRAFLFITVRGVASAAVRLGLIGAFEAQALQAALASDIEQTLERCGNLEPAAIAQTAPLLDLCQSTHDRLYSRLFQS